MKEELKEVKKQRKEKEEELRIDKIRQYARKKVSVERECEEEKAISAGSENEEDTPEEARLPSQQSSVLLSAAPHEVPVETGRAPGAEDTSQKTCPPSQTQWGATTGDDSFSKSLEAPLTHPS